jgi:predicted HTH domain antitoxin
MSIVTVGLKEDIAQFVKARAVRTGQNESSALEALIEERFEQRLAELYEMYQQGEISLGYLAEQLGMTTWRVYHLLEERGLRTANV